MTQPERSKLPEQEQFDFSKSELLKIAGMERAAGNRAQLLALAREVAMFLGKHRRIVHADMVQDFLIKHGYHPVQLGNAAGSIFRGDHWECVGTYRSTRVSNHSRRICLWRLKA